RVRAERDERQVQHGGAHLGSVALPLVGQAEPGTGAYGALLREVTGRQALDADHIAPGAAPKHGELAIPVLLAPGVAFLPPPVHDGFAALRGPDVGPGVGERLHGRVVDAVFGEAGEA